MPNNDETLDYRSGVESSVSNPSSATDPKGASLNLSALSVTPDDNRTTRLAKLRSDQHRRYQQRRPVPVERYLEQFADEIDDEAAVDLIYSEVLLREQIGEAPTMKEYVDRFPQFAEPLRQQFEVFKAMQSILFEAPTANPGAAEVTLTFSRINKQTNVDLPQIPGYEILSQLGRGGMGVVVKAKQTGLNRVVALKMIHLETSDDLLARFRVEAETIARLQHPNIVQIFDIGDVDGKPFFSMEFVAGGALADHCSDKPMFVRQAAQLVEASARAVHAAHECSIIHRDLKPANILVLKKADGELVPKIADFGLAKQLDQAGDLTASGALMGTPNYMAPEQAEGRIADVGPAADIHALGCILYQLLTGRKAFEGKSMVETLTKIRTEAPTPPSRHNPRIHADLETICLKCLQKAPNRRYASAEALADDLQRFLNGEPIEARRVGRLERFAWWCRRHPATTVTAIAGMILAFVVLPGWLWYQAELRASKEREQLIKQAADSDKLAKREAEKAKHEAEKAEQAAQELATTQEHYALINRTKQRSLRKPLGWTWAGMKDLNRAAQLNTKARSDADLREEVARCMSGIDVRLKAVWAKNLPHIMVEFSPDGKYLAAADYRINGFIFPANVRLLDGDTGKQLHKLIFPPSLVLNGSRPVPDGTRSLVFTNDGKQLLVGTRAGRVYRWWMDKLDAKPDMWKIKDGMELQWLLPAPDGKSMIVSGPLQNKISKWRLDAVEKTPVAEFEAPDEVNWVGRAPYGTALAFDCDKWPVRFLDSEKLTLVNKKHREFEANLWPAAFDGHGHLLCGYDREDLSRAHVLTGAVTHKMRHQNYRIGRAPDLIRLNRDASLVLTLNYADDIRSLQLWELISGKLQANVKLTGSHFSDVAFHPLRNAFVLAYDKRLELYEIGGLQTQTRIASQALPIEDFAFISEGDELVCVGATGGWHVSSRAITRWRTSDGRFDGVLPPQWSSQYRPDKSLIATNPRTSDIVTLTQHGYVDAWNYKTGLATLPWKKVDPLNPSALEFDSDGRRLWVISDEAKTLQSYNWPSPEIASTWQDSIRQVEGTGHLYCLAAEKKYVLVGGQDGVTHLIRADDAQFEKSFAVRRSSVWSLAINSTETLAASGFQDGKVQIYRVPSGEIAFELDDHLDSVTSIDFSPDDQLLATGSRDGTLNLYRIGNESVIKLITFTSGPIRQVMFHPGGDILAFSVDRESGLRLWHLGPLRKRFAEMGIGFK